MAITSEEQARASQLTERQRTILARFTDWTRPRLAKVNVRDVWPLVETDFLYVRTVRTGVHGKATEYRLTAAGSEAIGETAK